MKKHQVVDGLNSTKSEVGRMRLAAGTPQSSGFGSISDLIGAEEGGPRDVSSRKKQYLKVPPAMAPSEPLAALD